MIWERLVVWPRGWMGPDPSWSGRVTRWGTWTHRGAGGGAISTKGTFSPASSHGWNSELQIIDFGLKKLWKTSTFFHFRYRHAYVVICGDSKWDLLYSKYHEYFDNRSKMRPVEISKLLQQYQVWSLLISLNFNFTTLPRIASNKMLVVNLYPKQYIL